MYMNTPEGQAVLVRRAEPGEVAAVQPRVAEQRGDEDLPARAGAARCQGPHTYTT